MLKLPTTVIKKIAVFRALQLGDILCSIPAIRALRMAYPNAQIAFLGLPHTEGIVNRFPHYIDQFIPFPGHPGLPEQNFDPELYGQFLKKMIEIKFDLIIQLQGNGSVVNRMIRDFRAVYSAGFCEHPDGQNALFLPYPNFGHEITRHLALMEHLGITSTGKELEFPLSINDQELLNEYGLSYKPGSYICIHPGSRGSWRQWPPLYFAGIADYCIAHGFKVILTGTNEELRLVESVASLMHAKPIISAGRTSLGAVALLIKNAFGLVANCTGVSHLAAALGTPSVIISMDGEAHRWAPLNIRLHKTIDWTKSQDYNQVLQELSTLLINQQQ